MIKPTLRKLNTVLLSPLTISKDDRFSLNYHFAPYSTRRFAKPSLLPHLLINERPMSLIQYTRTNQQKTISEYLEQASSQLKDRYSSLQSFLLGLGDDAEEKTTNYYVAFRRLRNFACVEIRISTDEILVFTKVDPETIHLEDGFTRDVSQIGHYGTGNLEIKLKTTEDLEKAKPLLIKSYELS